MKKILQYQVFTLYISLMVALWVVLKEETESTVVQYAPFWLVIAMSLWAVFSILRGVAYLENSPNAAAEIEKDVGEARAVMKKRGIIS
jgi:hypothetical protein